MEMAAKKVDRDLRGEPEEGQIGTNEQFRGHLWAPPHQRLLDPLTGTPRSNLINLIKD